MKLKNIKSFSHNFSHSFVSFENYIDGDYIFKDLKTLSIKAKGNKVSIYWIYPDDKIPATYNERITKSIKYYKEKLSNDLSNYNLEVSVIEELRTDIFIASNKQVQVQAYAKDINGKEYIKNINDFADCN